MKDPFYRVGIFSILIIFCGLTSFLSRRFPPVNTDEVVVSVHGFNLISGHGQRYSLYDDVFASSVYQLRDIFPDITRTGYNAWVGLFTCFTTGSYWAVRFSSVVAGLIVIVCMYLIGGRLENQKLGLISAAFYSICPVILVAACLIRNEIVVSCCVALVLVFYLSTPSFSTKDLIMGCMGGILIGVHPNSVAAFAGILTLDIFLSKDIHWVRKTAKYIVGFILGVTFIFMTVDTKRLALSLKYALNYQLVVPPILKFPWKPWIWTKDLLVGCWEGRSFYISTGPLRLWAESLRLYYSVMVLCIAIPLGRLLLWDREKLRQRWETGFFLAIIVSLVVFTSLVERKDVMYLTVFLPFIVPLMASGFIAVTQIERRKTAFILKALILPLSALSILVFFRFAYVSINSSLPYDRMVEEVQAVVPLHARVIGPNFLWFSWEKNYFRDIGSLLYSKWYTGEDGSLSVMFDKWKPDILIIDDTIRKIYFKNKDLKASLESDLSHPVESLGLIVSRTPAYGNMEIYRIYWTRDL